MNGTKICRFIQVKRKERGLTVEQFAAEVGVATMVARQWENGVVPPTELLLAIAKVLNVDVSELLRGLDEPTEIETAQTELGEETQTGEGAVEKEAENVNPQPEILEKPKKSKETENFEVLTRKMTESDRLAYQVEPSGKNGFYNWERLFACLLCFGFLFIILFHYLFIGIAFVTRDRKLTMENYNQYFSVEVEVANSNGVADIDRFYVYVKPKDGMREISNFNLTVTVTMPYSGGGNYVGDVSFQAEKFTHILQKSVIASKQFSIRGKAEVISVSGDIA